MEIENKYLIDRIPNGTVFRKTVSRIAYLPVPEQIRIADVSAYDPDGTFLERYFLLCRKAGTGQIREEDETYVSEDAFRILAASVRKPFLEKTRLCIQSEHPGTGKPVVLEANRVDMADGTSFRYGEVEFPSARDSVGFRWPDGSAVDVTEDPYWKMHAVYLRQPDRK